MSDDHQQSERAQRGRAAQAFARDRHRRRLVVVANGLRLVRGRPGGALRNAPLLQSASPQAGDAEVQHDHDDDHNHAKEDTHA